MSFPVSLPSYTGYIASETLLAANNAAQLNQMQADEVAIATKLGTGSSTPTNGTVLVGSGTGTSTWGQVALGTGTTGLLPVNQGGTGQGASTGSGGVVLQTSPTINSPTENNGTYNNPILNNIPSGSIPAAAIANNSITLSQLAASGLALPTITYNPYKFSVYLGSNQTVSSNTWTLVNFNTKVYDTGSNFSTSTNLFTVPVAGFYVFSACIVALGADTGAIGVGVNVGTFSSSPTYQGSLNYTTWTGNPQCNMTTPPISLSANQTVGAYGYTASTSLGSEANFTWFSGFLVSAT